MIFLKGIYQFSAWFAVTKWWPFWSNFRFRKAVRRYSYIDAEDAVENLEDIQNLSRRVMRFFNYTADGLNQLGDAITPPPQNYLYYQEGFINDDCDGFHSVLYHCLTQSGVKCYLLSAVGPGVGHCLLVFFLNDEWHVLDYTSLYTGCSNLRDAVNKYDESFQTIYGKKIWYNALVEYNYKNGKFRGVRVRNAKIAEN